MLLHAGFQQSVADVHAPASTLTSSSPWTIHRVANATPSSATTRPSGRSASDSEPTPARWSPLWPMAMVYARSPSLETGDDLDAVAGTRAREGGTESTLSDELSDIRNALPRSAVHNSAHENIEFQDTLKPVGRLSVPAGCPCPQAPIWRARTSHCGTTTTPPYIR